MKPVLLEYLRCPDCFMPFDLSSNESRPISLSEEELAVIRERGFDPTDYGSEILTGRLQCRKCSASFPISQGVPRIYSGAENDFPLRDCGAASTTGITQHRDVKAVQTSFSREWDEFDYEDETIWHWTLEDRIATFSEEISMPDLTELRSKLMIDAGCGTGILSMNLAKRYFAEIIALDMAHVVSRAFKENKSNLCHFVQGSVLAPPLAEGIADITYSNGVLHHTYNTRKAFDAISRLTKYGGLFYVWLYGKKEGWNRIKYIMIDTFRLPISRLPKYPQTLVIYALAGFHILIRALKRILGMKVADIRSMHQLLVAVRDRYTPRYAREHREKEVIEWFRDNGFVNVSRRTTWEKTGFWKGSTDLAIKGHRARP